MRQHYCHYSCYCQRAPPGGPVENLDTSSWNLAVRQHYCRYSCYCQRAPPGGPVENIDTSSWQLAAVWYSLKLRQRQRAPPSDQPLPTPHPHCSCPTPLNPDSSSLVPAFLLSPSHVGVLAGRRAAGGLEDDAAARGREEGVVVT